MEGEESAAAAVTHWRELSKGVTCCAARQPSAVVVLGARLLVSSSRWDLRREAGAVAVSSIEEGLVPSVGGGVEAMVKKVGEW